MYKRQNHNKSFIKEIKWDNVALSQYLAEIFDDYNEEETIIPINKFKKQSEQNMFTILEKTILLKTVDLFQDIPGDLLSQISQISKAKNYENGEIIFKDNWSSPEDIDEDVIRDICQSNELYCWILIDNKMNKGYF